MKVKGVAVEAELDPKEAAAMLFSSSRSDQAEFLAEYARLHMSRDDEQDVRFVFNAMGGDARSFFLKHSGYRVGGR